MAPLNERFEMRLDEEMIRQIDLWRFARGGSRAEAARQLIAIGLAVDDQSKEKAKPVSPYSKGETLALFMLADVVRALKIKEPGIDPSFVEAALGGGHHWALEWEYSGVFRDRFDSEQALDDTLNVLDMWEMLELACEEMTAAEKKLVASAPLGKDVKFRGFDGNNEGEYMGIARFLTQRMDRFTRFKDRTMNSHMPSIDGYRRMLEVYLPLRDKLVGRKLQANEVIAILEAWVHPSNRK